MPENERMGLHVCCAPCFATALETMRRDADTQSPPLAGIFFYNPNIHPLLEFRRRQKALQVYLEREPVTAEIDGEYGLRLFLEQVAGPGGPPADRRERCRRCYSLRLGWTAARCVALDVPTFSTTLLASREQDRDLVADAGKEAAAKTGLKFVVRDFRKFLPEEKALRGIYKQQYCGCIFSEEERYGNTRKHLYRSGEEGEADAL